MSTASEESTEVPAELWLLVGSGPLERGASEIAAGFAGRAPAIVLAPEAGSAARLGSDLAAAFGARLVATEALADPAPDETDPLLAERAWEGVASVRTGVPGERLLVAAAYDLVRVLTARALGAPLERSRAITVDPGRLVLLRQGSVGLDLRHANVERPSPDEGWALPGPEAGKARR